MSRPVTGMPGMARCWPGTGGVTVPAGQTLGTGAGLILR
jgi:hypothetical protein